MTIPMMRCVPFSVAIAVLGLGVAGPANAQEPSTAFRAGAATANITPRLGYSINGNMTDIKARHVHDELHARALVLDDGKTRLAFVVADSCMLPESVVASARSLIAGRSGVPEDHLLISATHSHSCGTAAGVFQSDPDESYTGPLAVKIADAVQLAVNNLAPARVGWGSGRNAEQVHNRRWRMKPGTVGADPFGGTRDAVRMNPPVRGADNVEPAGPVDPEVSVVSVRTPDGRPVALLANYGLHYVGGVGPGHLSADYFGAFADRVQELLKADRHVPPFVGIMSNGTSGDVNNIDFRNPRAPQPPYARIKLVADELAREAVRVAAEVAYHDTATLDARAAVLSLAVRKPDAEEFAKAEAILKGAEGRELAGLAEFYARETVKLSAFPDRENVTVQALRIGGLAVVGIPCEVFAEIGLKIKAESALKPVFTISLANGYNGYLPTREQHALGGYETWRARSSRLEVDAASKISTKALELLKELAEARTAEVN